AAFEQAGSSMNVFAAQNTDRTLWGLLDAPFPATWYQSVNPAAIILFAPVFAWLWTFLGHRGLNPSTPTKFALGLWLLGLAFLAMVFGAMDAQDGLAAPHWLLITFVVYTWGELCLSPVGLSMVTKLAPLRLQSLMMGLWFFSFSLSNLLAGLVARYSVKLESGEATFLIEGLPGFYLLLVVAPIATGFLIWFISPTLRRWMHGVE
ncbi:MAG: oligopeptide:H+ symporter, partial [Gammaproteobacteria bacterium]|nr:oligopeptide:H+ symporter [Gammaproteobacteria bacterium]